MLIDMNTAPAKLVTFGAGGDSVHFTRGCYSQGYGTPERPHAADPATKNIPDGTPVVDTRPAVNTKEGFAWAIKGPLVDVDLAEGECAPLELDTGHDWKLELAPQDGRWRLQGRLPRGQLSARLQPVTPG